MSYFYKNRIYDAYVIDKTIYANDGDIFVNDFIEIFNNEEFVLDFTNTSMVCSNEKIKGTELHKIKIKWGDGHEDVLVKELGDGGSSLNVVFDSWKKVKHLFNHDKRSIYLSDDISSLPAINVYFYNTYNDIIKMTIPYKLVYKSLYDLNCQFNLISGHTGNDYLSTFVLKEGTGDSLSVVQTINPVLSLKDDEIEYVTNTTSSVDYSNDFVDEDNVMWAWDQIPYVQIVPQLTFVDSVRSIKVDCYERTVPVEKWNPRVEKILDSGNEPMKSVKNDENGAFSFYIFGDGFENIESGLYKIDLNVLGINDVNGYTDEKYFGVPTNSNYASTVVYNGVVDDDENGINYYFSATKGDDVQWCYLKNTKLFFKPYEIDTSDDGLGDSNFDEADESFLFEFPIDLDKKDGIVEIPKKSLPNGNYRVWCSSEDLLNNKIDTTSVEFRENNVKDFAWRYTDIGKIVSENKTENESTIFQWTVSGQQEMDKIQFKLEYRDGEENPWEILYNEKKPHNHWVTETIIDSGENKGNHVYTFDLLHNQYSDGTYKATMAHILDMNESVGERRIETDSEFELIYDVPKITINSINPTFQYNNTTKSWIPYMTFGLDYSKNDVSDVTMIFEYENGYKKNKSIKPSLEVMCSTEECFGDYDKFDASFTCRDANDYFFRRTEKNPQKIQIGKNTSDFLICHTSVPKFDEIVDAFGEYQDENGDRLSGIDVVSQTALDVYRNYKCEVKDDENTIYYYKFVDEIQKEDGTIETKEANYFGDKISFFMLKKFTPIILDQKSGKEKIEYDKSFYRFVQADKFSNEGMEWSKLGTVSDKFVDGIKYSFNYVPDLDKVVVNVTDPNLNKYEDIIYNKVRLIKDNIIVYEQVAKDIQNEHKIGDVELGDYTIEIDYSSIDTSTTDGNRVSQKMEVRADKNKVITDVKMIKNSAGDGNYTVNFSWKLNHKRAQNLTLFINDGSKTISFDNALMYDSYSPPFYFSSGEKLTCWFQMTSNLVDFDLGNTGEVFRKSFTV